MQSPPTAQDPKTHTGRGKFQVLHALPARSRASCDRRHAQAASSATITMQPGTYHIPYSVFGRIEAQGPNLRPKIEGALAPKIRENVLDVLGKLAPTTLGNVLFSVKVANGAIRATYHEEPEEHEACCIL